MIHTPQTFDELFLQNCAVEPLTECWVWQGERTRQGYGLFFGLPAHRYSYEMHHEHLPIRQPLDHLCRAKACVNPEHLELVTHYENSRRARMDKAQGKRFLQFFV